jgi:signal transduction histidine kinase
MNRFISKIWNISFRTQLIYGIVSILTLFIISFTYITTKKHSDFLHAEAMKEAVDRSLELAIMSQVWVMANDYIGLEEVVNTFKVYDDLIFATIIDMDGKIIAHTDPSIIGKYIADERRISYLKKSYEKEGEHVLEQEIFQHTSEYIDIVRIIHYKNKHIGLVNLRLDYNRYQKSIDTEIFQSMIFTVLYMLIAIVFAFFMSNGLTRELSKLMDTMKKVRDGDKSVRADEEGVRELSELSHEFNRTLDALKQLENELVEQEEIMIAQSRHVAMGEMIGMIAHQWRQPLTVIAMSANNIIVDIELEEVNEESFKNEAQNILHQTEHLSKTIDDFKNFFRPNREKEMVKVEDIVFEAESIIGKSIENNDITLSIEHDTTAPIAIYSREFLQVIINLLNNSKEALIDNTKENRSIHVEIKDTRDFIVTTICDNGGGIDEKIMKKIFEPYFSTKDKLTGTGLGLYISKNIIEKHLGGTIRVRNTQDGACFKLDIPKQYKDQE